MTLISTSSSAEQVATSSEKAIWRAIRSQPQDTFSTLSYQFHLNDEINLDKINRVIYRLLTEYAPELNLRFYCDSQGQLYKRVCSAPNNPVISARSPTRKKPLFIDEFVPLYRFYWYSIDAGPHLEVHLSHLIIDGYSYTRFCQHLDDAYHSTPISNKPDNLKKAQHNEQSSNFWKSYLSKQSLFQSLPFFDDRKSTGYIQNYIKLTTSMTKQIQSFVHEENCTVFEFFTAIVTILIHRYCQMQDGTIPISLSYYCRLNPLAKTLNCDSHLFPLFLSVENHNTIRQVITHVQEQRNRQRPHLVDALPYATILDKDQVVQDHFNIVINQSEGLLPQQKPIFCQDVIAIDNHSYPKDLTLTYSKSQEAIHARFESCAGSLYSDLLEQLASDFEQLVAASISNQQTPLNAIVLDQRTATLQGKTITDKYSHLPNYLDRHLSSRAECTAIQDAEGVFCYQEVHTLVDQLCHYLQDYKKKHTLHKVILLQTRDRFLPISLLACLKAGVTFTPIPVDTPHKYLEQIIQQDDYPVILHDDSATTLIKKLDCVCDCINISTAISSKNRLDQPCHTNIDPEHIAYVIYTSGTTGKPKGVQVSYHNLSQFIHSIAEYPGISPSDTLLAITSISFDIAINELLLPLLYGAKLYICSDDVRTKANKLSELIDHQAITILQSTPVTLDLLKNNQWQPYHSIRLWVGGEALPYSLAQYFLERDCRVFNMYGPTEATIWVATQRLARGDMVTIGEVVNNTCLSVVDSQGDALPLGIEGELMISGSQVAKGYVHGEDSRFFHDQNNLPCYRTGDRVIAISYNHIRYLKRMDDQVKLRGYRIETHEIDRAIEKIIPDITVITVKRDIPNPHLCGFYTGHLSHNEVNQQLKHCIQQILPSYKIPSTLIHLNQFPQNKNNKIDRRQLETANLEDLECKKSDDSNQPSSRQKPTDTVTLKLLDLISTLLQQPITEIDTSLIEYGLSSLNINQLSILIEQHFATRIDAHQFYQLSTIKKISHFIQRDTCQIDSNPSFLQHSTAIKAMPLAIVGYDALLPGGHNAAAFWQSLINNDCLIKRHDRNYLGEHAPAGFLADITQFDCQLFKISPREAKLMDPRQRLLLQCAFKTLQHSNYQIDALSNEKIGCFVAATGNDYLHAQIKSKLTCDPYSLSGTSLSMLANRISYHFNWKGPSIFTDTACSGSLTALSQAAQSLYLNKTSLCFVAAANVIADTQLYQSLKASHFLSASGNCATFSEQANGYVRGEGVIGFMIKRLSDAKKDGDTIHAVIEQIGENHGGQAASLTSPCANAQSSLLVDTYSPLHAKHLSYIESHGTGTRLGDPIEVDALKAFENDCLKENLHESIALGTLKPNIGHLEAAAGFSSLLKVILCMKHQIIPANINSEPVNSAICLKNSKFVMPKRNQPWRPKKKFIAGISSFGFGGSNAHVILSKYDAYHEPSPASERDSLQGKVSLNEKSYWYKSIENTIDSHSDKLFDDIQIDQCSEYEFTVIIPYNHVFFDQHRVFDHRVLPAVAQLEIVIKALNLDKNVSTMINDVLWLQPIVCQPMKYCKLQIKVSNESKNLLFSVSSLNQSPYCQGKIQIGNQTMTCHNTIRLGNKIPVSSYDHALIYNTFKKSGINYGIYFRPIQRLLVANKKVKAHMVIKSKHSLVSLMDGALQSSMAESIEQLPNGLMPFSVGKLTIFDFNKLYELESAIVYAEKVSSHRANLQICNCEGKVLLDIKDLGVKSSKLQSVLKA